jgi:putative peptidoglycan lipid II flippase
MARPSVARTALTLLPLQLILRAVEVSLPLLLALWFGRSELTDVYCFASAVFTLAGSVVFSAFQDSAVVAVLAELRLADPHALPAVRGSLLSYTLIGAVGVAAAFGAFAACWFAVRYTGPPRAAALAMIIPFGAYLVALSTKTFLGATLAAEHRYVPVPVAGAVGALTSISVVAGARSAFSVVSIPVGLLAGELAAIAVLAMGARAAGVSIAATLERPEPVRRIARLVASEVGGSAVTRVNPVVDQLVAGVAGIAGGGTLLKLSADVASVPTSLLQAALLPVLLTHLSEDFAAAELSRLRSTLARVLATVVALLAGATAVIWLARGPLVSAVFAHGAMDPAGVDRLIRLLPYQLVGVVPFGVLLVLARAHVAMQNSRIMVSMGVLNACLNAGMNVALLRPLGLEGLALATSVTHSVVALVFAMRLHKRLALGTSAGVALPAGSA